MTVAPAGAALLWALHPHALVALLRQAATEAIMPEKLRLMAAHLAASRRTAPAPAPAPSQAGAVLVLPITGLLAPAGMLAGGTSYDWIIDRVGNAAADKRVGTIVLALRSPGGAVWGCEEAGNAIYAARSIKPVIAVADPYCFSAAHWLGTQASRYYVTTSGEIGSVGIRSGHVDTSGFEAIIGMKTTLIASSPDKIAAHPYAPLSDADRAVIQSSINAANRRFGLAIARGRGMCLVDVAGVHGTGKTFTARRALDRRAIDGIATLREVIARHGTDGGRLDLMRRQAAINTISAGI